MSASLDDLQSEVDELRRATERVKEALGNAESCESVTDFKANIDEAVNDARTLFNDLRTLQTMAAVAAKKG